MSHKSAVLYRPLVDGGANRDALLYTPVSKGQVVSVLTNASRGRHARLCQPSETFYSLPRRLGVHKETRPKVVIR
jgi:hypothetical protein